MLSSASVDALRDYKGKHTKQAPKTPMYKGFSLARTRAEHARSLRSRARALATLACYPAARPKGGAFRSPLGLPPSSMRHDVLGMQGEIPPHPPDRSVQVQAPPLGGIAMRAKPLFADPPGSPASASTPLEAVGHRINAVPPLFIGYRDARSHAGRKCSRSAGFCSPASLASVY